MSALKGQEPTVLQRHRESSWICDQKSTCQTPNRSRWCCRPWEEPDPGLPARLSPIPSNSPFPYPAGSLATHVAKSQSLHNYFRLESRWASGVTWAGYHAEELPRPLFQWWPPPWSKQSNWAEITYPNPPRVENWITSRDLAPREEVHHSTGYYGILNIMAFWYAIKCWASLPFFARIWPGMGV